MEARFLINTEKDSDILCFYVNPNGNNARIFFRSQEAAQKALDGYPESKDENLYKHESGRGFLDALKAKASTQERKDELQRDFGTLASSYVIKLTDLSKLHLIVKATPFKTVSGRAYFELLQFGLKFQKTFMADREQAMRQGLSPNAAQDVERRKMIENYLKYQDFLVDALAKGVISFDEMSSLFGVKDGKGSGISLLPELFKTAIAAQNKSGKEKVTGSFQFGK